MTPQALKQLHPDDLKKLLDYLATIKVKIQYSNAKGKLTSKHKHNARKSKRWEKSNGACAIALYMATHSQHRLFVKMVSLAPNAIIGALHDSLFGLLPPMILAKIIRNMLLELDGTDIGKSNPRAQQICSLVYSGLQYWVGKNIALFDAYLGTLLSESMNSIEKYAHVAREQRHGILIGAVIAALMLHAGHVKKVDDKRIWVINLVANLAWAATSFIGAAPIAGQIAAGLAGEFLWVLCCPPPS